MLHGLLALASRDALEALGYAPDWHEYPMGHAVCPEEVAAIAVAQIRRRLGGLPGESRLDDLAGQVADGKIDPYSAADELIAGLPGPASQRAVEGAADGLAGAGADHGAGDEVIYPNPGFPIYESQILASGARPVPIHLREARGFSFDPDELERLITPRTKLLILNYPHNPTGGLLSRSELEQIAAILKGDNPEVERSYAHLFG